MLKLINLTHTFQGGFEPVLKGLSLELNQGDFCVVIGSNGSGKSTLMRAISGEYRVDKGLVLLGGTDLTQQDRSSVIASVVQDVNKGTIPEMTLLENMAISALRGKKAKFALYSTYKDTAIDQLKELNLGLENYIHTPLSHLSGGQRQVVATLMAINSHPQVLLLDEHTAALDPKRQALLMESTSSAVAKHRMTTLMITHKLDDALNYGNRLIMLHKGQIVLDVTGTKKQALSIHALLDLFHQHSEHDYDH